MRIGDKIKDNDPRMGNRILIIESFDDQGHVRARRILHFGKKVSYPKKGFRIKITRIHSDGKPRKSGFTLMPEPDRP